MRWNTSGACVGLAAVVALACATPPQDLAGTWVAEGVNPQILSREPQNLRVLVIRDAGNGLVGKLLVPTLTGLPVAVERQGDHVRLTIQMARGMENALEGTFSGDRLGVATPGDARPPVMLRRASEDELRILESLAPKKHALPAVKELPANGLAATPPMGFSTWNHFQTEIDVSTIREIADALVTTGMRDAGYVYVNIDDGWQGERDQQGNLHSNQKFPDMKLLAGYLHARGLKLGIYTSPGPKSCAGFEGSYGHEEQDARTFAEWNIDYVKYDWCSAGLIYDDAEMPAAYQKMAEAIRATGRPMVFSICQYGRSEVWKWGAAAGGNLWRTTGDIADRWDVVSAIGFSQDNLAPFAGPGHWNDPDMLEVGNGGMSAAEYRTHVSLWALLASPLIAGHDVRHSSPETISILTNPELIAIDQDRLGRPGKRIAQRGAHEIWTRPLDGGRIAVALFNRADVPGRIEAGFSELELGLGARASARDVWGRHSLGILEGTLSAEVEPHGVMLAVFEPLRDGGS